MAPHYFLRLPAIFGACLCFNSHVSPQTGNTILASDWTNFTGTPTNPQNDNPPGHEESNSETSIKVRWSWPHSSPKPIKYAIRSALSERTSNWLWSAPIETAEESLTIEGLPAGKPFRFMLHWQGADGEWRGWNGWFAVPTPVSPIIWTKGSSAAARAAAQVMSTEEMLADLPVVAKEGAASAFHEPLRPAQHISGNGVGSKGSGDSNKTAI